MFTAVPRHCSNMAAEEDSPVSHFFKVTTTVINVHVRTLEPPSRQHAGTMP